MKQNIHNFMRSERGVAALEFALILPVMVITLVGMVEVWRIVQFDQKLESATFQIADLVTQNEEVSLNQLDQYANAVSQIMEPFEFNGKIIFTSVASLDLTANPTDDRAADAITNDATIKAMAITPARAKIGCKGGCVLWQVIKNRGTAVSGNTKIGRPGGNAVLPNEYKLLKTQNVLAVEIYAQREPMLEISRNIIEAFVPKTTYAVSVYKPRQDNLLVPPT